MKRPTYFQQVAPAAPARRRAGAAVLTPAPLLFRPSAADTGFQEVETSTAARPAARAAPADRSQPAPERASVQEARPATAPMAAAPSLTPPTTPAAEAGMRILERMTETRTERAITPPSPATAPVAPPAAAGQSAAGPLQPPAAAPVIRKVPSLAPGKLGDDGQTSVEERIVRAAPEPAPPTLTPARETALPQLQPRPAAPLPLITPAAPPPRAAPVREPAAGGLHIGTLEVRVTAPAPPQAQPQPAPRAMARGSARRASGARIARGFGVFGLGQS